jgi:hypothetical protein
MIMSSRLTTTDKWKDSWFSNLKPNDKLLFLYLCDNCNNSGIIEYNPKIWSAETGIDIRGIEGALKGLASRIIWSIDYECIYIRNFLKHQRNIPINPTNKAHIAIIRGFESYSKKFNITNVDDFVNAGLEYAHENGGVSKGDQRGIEGGSKGDQSPPVIYSINNNTCYDNSSKRNIVDDTKRFYDEQILLSNGDTNYKAYVSLLFGDNKVTFRPLEGVLSIPKQLLYKEFLQLYQKYRANGVKLFDMTLELDNYKKNKDYKNLYQVLLSWLNRRIKK